MSDCAKKDDTMGKESQTGGVRAISIQGRLARERERLTCMTDEERAWRAKWIRDQILCDHEPVEVPEIRNQLLNPIRRFYRYPLDRFAEYLAPKLGKEGALVVRTIVGASLMMTFGIYCAAYYFKYNANDWTRKGGWRVLTSRKSVSPGQEGWPRNPDRMVGADYSDRGFINSPIQKSLISATDNGIQVLDPVKDATENGTSDETTEPSAD